MIDEGSTCVCGFLLAWCFMIRGPTDEASLSLCSPGGTGLQSAIFPSSAHDWSGRACMVRTLRPLLPTIQALCSWFWAAWSRSRAYSPKSPESLNPHPWNPNSLPCWCREQEEQQARREELRRQEDEAAALLESHGLCALRGFPELATQCEGSDFRVQRA